MTRIELPTGPKYMDGFGSLDWDPEWAEFVIWREQRAQEQAARTKAAS